MFSMNKMKKVTRRFEKSLLIVLGIVLLAGVVVGIVNFGDDVRVTNDVAFSGFSKLAVDSAGVHEVWMDERDGNMEIYYKKLDDNGSSITSDIRLSTDAGISWFPSLDSDGSGIHVVWVDERDGNTEIYYEKLDSDGNTLIDDLRLTNDVADSTLPEIGVDLSNDLQVVWIDGRDGNSEVYYKKLDNDGNVLVDDIRLTDDEGVSWFPKIAVDGSGIHVVWIDDRDGNSEVYYTKLDLDGDVVVDDKRITNDVGDSSYPSVFVDGDVHIAWLDTRDGNSEIYYKKLDNNGNDLTSDLRVSDDADVSWYPSLSVDEGVHITWVDGRDGNLEIYFTELDGDGNKVVNDTRLTFLGESTLPILAPGSVHLTWTDTRDGNAEIYYKAGIEDDVCEGADTNNNGIVDANDLSKVRENFGNVTCGASRCEGADTNGDGFVDANDLSAVRTHFGRVDCSVIVEPVGEEATEFVGVEECRNNCKNEYGKEIKLCRESYGEERALCSKYKWGGRLRCVLEARGEYGKCRSDVRAEGRECLAGC
jgi:hypothetical protein